MPTEQKIEYYVAKRPFAYNGVDYDRGDPVDLIGSRYDDTLKETHLRKVVRPAGAEHDEVQALVDEHLAKELRTMCEERGLPIYGTKEELATRIMEHDGGGATPSENGGD